MLKLVIARSMVVVEIGTMSSIGVFEADLVELAFSSKRYVYLGSS